MASLRSNAVQRLPGGDVHIGHSRDLAALIKEVRAGLVELELLMLDSPPAVDRRTISHPIERVTESLRERDHRRQVLGWALSTEPAWGILLHLYASHLAQQRLTIGRLATYAKLPNTTAIRWLQTLADRSFVSIREDPLDHRRKFVELTEKALVQLGQLFETPASDAGGYGDLV